MEFLPPLSGTANGYLSESERGFSTLNGRRIGQGSIQGHAVVDLGQPTSNQVAAEAEPSAPPEDPVQTGESANNDSSGENVIFAW